MKIFKIVLIVVFTILLVLVVNHFSFNAMWGSLARNPLMFIFEVSLGGLFSWFTVSKINVDN